MNSASGGDQFDLVIIGAGPGGYVAAIRASQLGMKTVVVERESLGGICLNWGCIPTKALLKSTEVYEMLGHLKDYGLSVERASFDFAAIIQRSRGVAGQLNAGVRHLMKKNNVEVVEGSARFTQASDARVVSVRLKAGGERQLRGKSVIIATGARARIAPSLGMVGDGDHIWTYRDALAAKKLPKSLVVIGSGAIGIEFASFYRALGVDVTVLEAQDRILPLEDAEVSQTMQKSLESRGLKFQLSAQVRKVAADSAGATVEFESGKPAVKAEVVLIAIGIEGNVEELGLDKVGVKIDRGHIVTDPSGATNVPGVYAIGDVAGPPWLAHKASHEGIHCVEQIAGMKPSGVHAPIPSCTYSQPQVASVGLTEEQARKQYKEVKVGRFPLRVNGKAIASGQTEGFVKVVFDAATGQFLGAHMVGSEVTEMIQGYAIAMALEATEAELMGVVFPHPSISEAMQEAVFGAFGRSLHV